jgi:hypothetical protein
MENLLTGGTGGKASAGCERFSEAGPLGPMSPKIEPLPSTIKRHRSTYVSPTRWITALL